MFGGGSLKSLDVLLGVFLYVFSKCIAINNLDVGGEADDEAAYAFEAGDGGVEEPGFAVLFEVFGGHREFFHEQGFGAGVEPEFDGDGSFAGHTEHIDIEAAMV